MSLFRPARKVSCPNGDYWEPYASKTALPSLRGRGGVDTVALPLGPIGAVWRMIAPFARVLALLPVAVVRGRRSRAVRIEAVRNYPDHEVPLWTTTDGRLDAVLDEIAAWLVAGKFVLAVPDRIRSYFLDGITESALGSLRARRLGASDLVEALPAGPG